MTEAVETDRRTIEQERLFTGYTGRVTIALSLGWLATQLGAKLIPPLLPTIIAALAITPSKAGFALTITGAIRSLLLYPGGRSSDLLSRTTVLVAGLGVMAVGYAVLTGTFTYPVFLFGLAVIGIGSGMYNIPTRAFFSELFVERRGEALGVFAAAGMLGSALAAALAIVALQITTWRLAFVPVVGVLILVLVLLHVWSREPYRIALIDLGVWETISRVFRTTTLRYLVLVYTLVIFTWTGTLGFLPTFLQADKAFSPTLASAWFAIPPIVGVLVMPIAGGLSDRFSRLPVMVFVVLLAVLGLGIMVVSTGLVSITLGVVVFSMGLMSFTPVMQSYLLDIFPNDSAGGDFGAFKTVYSGLASFGPMYVGVVAEHASYTTAFGGMILCLITALGVLLLTVRRG